MAAMIVLTTLLTSTPDPQRGVRWEPDPEQVRTLAESVERHGLELVVLHDEPVDHPDFGVWELVDREHPNPYFDRWRLYADAARGADVVWCVDATDVEMLHDPTPDIDMLHVGTEPGLVGQNGWLTANHPTVTPTLGAHPDWPMHNAGLIGGQGATVSMFAGHVYRLANRYDRTDMGVFNVLSHAWSTTTDWPHTAFKAFEYDHPTAWFRHK